MSKLTAEEKFACAMVVLEAMKKVVESGVIKKECAKRDGSFKKACAKDAHELSKYVHRMIQFHSGLNVCIPTTTEFFIQNFADEVLGQKNLRFGTEGFDRKFTVYLLNNGVEELYHYLDEYAERLTEEFGFDKNRAARRWASCF